MSPGCGNIVHLMYSPDAWREMCYSRCATREGHVCARHHEHELAPRISLTHFLYLSCICYSLTEKVAGI